MGGFIFVFCLFLAADKTVLAAQPWDEPFSASTAEIAKAAAAVQGRDAEVVLLLDDHRFVIQKDGKTVSTFRRVYRILTASALEDWASVEQEWSPWHESKPELRARVISADGTAHWLDQKTIAESPVAQYDASIFSDDRVLRAPLPAAAEGAVVEYEVIQRDTAPLFAAGVARQLRVNTRLPLERFHAVVDAEKGVELRMGNSLIPQTSIRRVDSKSGSHIEVELGRRTT